MMKTKAQNRITLFIVATAVVFSSFAVFWMAPLTTLGQTPSPTAGSTRTPDPDPEVEALYQEQNAVQPGTRLLGGGVPPPQSPAGSPCTGFDVTCYFLVAVNLILDWLMALPFWLAQNLFALSFDINLNAFSAGNPVELAVRSGFPVVLGVVNMFFVLILLWIAIATAFDYEEYHASKLIPKLIIAALLINFSLPIGRAVVNLGNGIGGMFYNNLIERGGGSLYGVMEKLFNAAAIEQRIVNPAGGLNCRAGANAAECTRTIYRGIQKTDPATGVTVTAEQCSKNLDDAAVSEIYNANESSPLCQELMANAQLEYGKISETGSGLLAMMIAAKIVIYPIAIFVLFAGAILLFIRIISLAFILILGPVAFLFMILPKTQSHFNDWWDKLFKWSFFLPAFLFFFWLTFAIFSNISDSFFTIRAGGSQALDTFAALGAYLLAAAFMIGSLIVAEKMGVYGAKTVTGWGKNMAVKARGFTGDRVWKGAGKATEAFMGTRAGQGLAKIPLVRGIVRPAAAAVMKRGSAVEAKDASFYTRLPNARLSSILTTMGERQRQAVLGFLPMSRQRQFNADGTMRTAPTAAAGEGARNQAVQNQVLPVVDQATRNMPEEVRAAVRSGVEEAIRNQPLDANPEAIANAITAAAVTSARGVPSAVSDRDVRFAFESGNTPSQMQGAIARGQRQATAAPPQTSNDWEERVERLEAQTAEQAERRPA